MSGDRIPLLRAIDAFMEAKAAYDRARTCSGDETLARLAEVKAADAMFEALDRYLDHRIAQAARGVDGQPRRVDPAGSTATGDGLRDSS